MQVLMAPGSLAAPIPPLGGGGAGGGGISFQSSCSLMAYTQSLLPRQKDTHPTSQGQLDTQASSAGQSSWPLEGNSVTQTHFLQQDTEAEYKGVTCLEMVQGHSSFWSSQCSSFPDRQGLAEEATRPWWGCEEQPGSLIHRVLSKARGIL